MWLGEGLWLSLGLGQGGVWLWLAHFQKYWESRPPPDHGLELQHGDFDSLYLCHESAWNSYLQAQG